jgi:glycosyltransferase involved in cell wall biosynthesis
MHIVSFEKAEDLEKIEEFESLKKEAEDAGIIWKPYKYIRFARTVATGVHISRALAYAVGILKREKLLIVHCHGYMPAVAGLALKKLYKTQFIFDMDGLWVDEREETGNIKKGSLLGKLVRWFETRFVQNADHIVVLTKEAKKILEKEYDRGEDVSVVPNFVDTERFKPVENEVSSGPIIGIVGNVMSWYDIDSMLDFFKIFKDQKADAKLLILSRDQRDFIEDKLEEKGIGEGSYEIISAKREEMVENMSIIDGGLFFIKPTFSKKAAYPTKLGEFLACGIPCTTNEFTLDVTELIKDKKIGIVLSKLTKTAMEEGTVDFIRLLEEEKINQRCREVAEKCLALEFGIREYQSIYKRLCVD